MRSVNQKFSLAFALAIGICQTTFASEVILITSHQHILPTHFWDEMNVSQRAELWPILKQEERLSRWRLMSREERYALRQHISRLEKNFQPMQFMFFNGRPGKQNLTRMKPEEKALLRRQVIEVQKEIRRGIPYECTDPTNCPKTLQIHLEE